MKKIISWGIVLGAVAPVIAFAQDARGILTIIADIFRYIIPILITLAVIYFIWGVIMYLIGGDEEKKKKASGMIIRGLIGLFIIIAFWGIIRVVTDTFGVGPEQLNQNAIPCIPNEAAGIFC